MSEKIFTDLTVTELFAHPEHSIAYPLLARYDYPWEALDGIGDFIREVGKSLSTDDYSILEGDIYISKTAKVAPSAHIDGPCIICEGAELRHCAFIRGKVIVGAGAVVGNSVELKSCILFDKAQVPHFNYVGDSVLGYRAHMGAGAITSNFKSDGSKISIRHGSEALPTGRRKLGAMLGDFAEIGCNCVLNPGTVIGSNTTVYPLSSVRGCIEKNKIYKSRDTVIDKEER